MSDRTAIREFDAFELLRRDHDGFRRSFREHERLLSRPCDNEQKAHLVGKICLELSVHAEIEEALFYPAARAAMGGVGPGCLWDALDHREERRLVAHLDEMEAGDAGFDDCVLALGACTLAHIRDEEERIFATLRAAGIDAAALGSQIAHRQRALRADVTRLGLPELPAHAATWPVSCRYSRAGGSPTPARSSEVS